MYLERYVSEMQDKCGIHEEYIPCQGGVQRRPMVARLVRYGPVRQKKTFLHEEYMRDTCICKGDQDTCGIHPRYIMRYKARPQVGLEIRILECIPMYPTRIVSVSLVCHVSEG